MVSIAITNKYFLNCQNNLKCKVIPNGNKSTKIKKDTTCVSFKIQFLVRVNLAVTFEKNHQPRKHPQLILLFFVFLHACDKADKQHCHQTAHKRKAQQTEVMLKEMSCRILFVRFLHLRLSPRCCLARPRRSDALRCR